MSIKSILVEGESSNEASMGLDLGYLGCNPSQAYRNLSPAELVERALENGEGELSSTGALCVKTGKYTGRSPKSRYFVDTPDVHDGIAWGSNNQPLDPEVFERLWSRAVRHLDGREVYVFDGLAGAMRSHSKAFRVVCELASQCLFIHQLLVRPKAKELEAFGEGDFTVLAVPTLSFEPGVDGAPSEAVVAIDFAGGRILVAGTGYSGEIKKSIFSTMSYIMPDEGVLPMHCSANMNEEDGSVAVFFGLSGTGKTTLSADSSRAIVGDDEHGWGSDGIFNFEGGCYAKCIDLAEESEPEIYRAVRFGAIAENVILDPSTREVDYSDGSITDNTRVAYPVTFIPNAVEYGTAGEPDVIFFLTADAFGVLPPISRLTPEAAMYQFVSGFTSKVAGTEVGITEPVPTFSSLFGEPFMPRPAVEYAQMLGERLRRVGTDVYLVNTGWAGGGATDGASRIPLKYTRAMVSAARDGKLAGAPCKHDPVFNVEAVLEVPGVPRELLDPKAYWVACGRTEEAYEQAANKLAGLFQENFAKKYAGMDEEIASAGPRPM